jgi:hypothetical protein
MMPGDIVLEDVIGYVIRNRKPHISIERFNNLLLFHGRHIKKLEALSSTEIENIRKFNISIRSILTQIYQMPHIYNPKLSKVFRMAEQCHYIRQKRIPFGNTYTCAVSGIKVTDSEGSELLFESTETTVFYLNTTYVTLIRCWYIVRTIHKQMKLLYNCMELSRYSSHSDQIKELKCPLIYAEYEKFMNAINVLYRHLNLF